MILTKIIHSKRPMNGGCVLLLESFGSTGFIIPLDASMSLIHKLREKLTQIKEDIDKAEEREAEAKSLLKEAEVREEKTFSRGRRY